MPQIPAVPMPEVINQPRMSPQIAGSGWGSVADSADQVEKLALYNTQEYLRIQQAEDHVAMLTAQNEIKADQDQAVLSFQQRADYQNFTKDIADLKINLNEKYAKKYGDNPRVMRLLQPYLDENMIDVHKTVELRRLKLMNDQNDAELMKLGDNTMRDMAKTNDPDEKLKISSRFFEAVKSSKDNALLTAQEAYQMISTFNLDAEKTEVVSGAKSDDIRDLVHIQEKMENKESFQELRGADPEWLADKIEYVKTKIDQINQKNKTKADHTAINAFMTQILDQSTSENGEVDFDHAFDLLQNKDLQTKSGMNDDKGDLDMDRWEKARTALRAFQTDYKADQKERSDKAYDEATRMILGGKLSQARNMIAAPGFPAEHREALSNWIKEIAKGEGPTQKDSVAEYARLADIVDSSDDPQDAIDQIISSKRLTPTHAEKLIDRARATQSAEVKDAVTRSDQLINAQLAPSETLAQQVELLLTKDPKSLSAHDSELIRQTTSRKAIAGEAKEALHDWVREQNQLHASGKRDALTSQEIWEYTTRLASLKVEPMDQQIEDIRKIVQLSQPPVEGDKHIYQGYEWIFDGDKWVQGNKYDQDDVMEEE